MIGAEAGRLSVLLKYVLRRLLVLIPVLFLVTILISSLIYFSPGDPVRVMLGLRANEEAVAAIRAELGLDKPYYVRYLHWLGNAVRGNLGRSLQRNEKVSDLIAERLPATLEMMIFAIVVTLLIVPCPSASFRPPGPTPGSTTCFRFFPSSGCPCPGFGSPSSPSFSFPCTGASFPSPAGAGRSGRQTGLHYLALPGLILGIRQVALISRLIRASMLEILGEEYIRTARSKGLAERVVIYKHAFRATP